MNGILLESTQSVLLLALISALSRAGLNVIDRYQIGMRKLSIRSINFWNNAIPTIMIVLTAVMLGLHGDLAAVFLGWKTAAFAAVVQLVAYTFSFAFRYLDVNQVTVAAKLSDLFIPGAIFATTGHWDWTTAGFACATTLVCLPILRGRNLDQGKVLKAATVLMCTALVFQAGISPLLAHQIDGDWRYGLLFAAAVIGWRTIWSIMPLAFRSDAGQAQRYGLLLNRLFYLRCCLSVITQLTFVLAVSSAAAAVAWPLLNAAGLFAMLMAAFVLRERQVRSQKLIVLTITALAALRFIL
ncbi:hypothetical protein [Herbaspirillum sp. YR522]|uniref:hypothetical protein n=1 Tax=Herbaspirillum sp. YR522 TaxID=1144342 RepID=UPI00026FB3E9|nr:hypothetical protein [Herbaspirillum sp. YR522]EJM97740.1 hypothetical protein PMI40_04222 [Herbaspirillum sp. YR522]